ncbi:Poly(U)-binding-splicing factor PUF60-B [Intoshia linei]|uniref:Poly(U)-binding-splicing factor PUF60-B n=1 Tax=Intoshia linei TaxID=1819745 RepID=A0A177BBY0_9BILA|nr:Poly(U)-binding-splicing factor PUF60-B [Intoshia linei]
MNGVKAKLRQAPGIGATFLGPGAKRKTVDYEIIQLCRDDKDRINAAKRYAKEISVKNVLLKQTLSQQNQQSINFQDTLQKSQALALMCRIYVGSINFDISEEEVRQAFGPFGPIRNLSMSYDTVANKHKGFAFIEYETPEAGFLALDQMNGILMGGRNIKVGRPSNMPQASDIIEHMRLIAREYPRIYVSGIHQNVSENDIKSIFEAFGEITDISMVSDPFNPIQHKGYAYISYKKLHSAKDSIQAMNLFDLGGQFLRVGHCATEPNGTDLSTSIMPTETSVAAAAITAKLIAKGVKPTSKKKRRQKFSDAPDEDKTVIPPPAIVIPEIEDDIIKTVPIEFSKPMEEVSKFKEERRDPLKAAGMTTEDIMPPISATIKHQEHISISGTAARKMIMQKLQRNQDSRVVVLKNMVSYSDVDEFLKEEITGECSKYGLVEKVVIYNEPNTDHDRKEDMNVKIFVCFSKPEEMENAINSLNGRYFACRIVRAEKYDQGLFEANDFSL